MDWKAERAMQTKREQAMGRKIVIKNMAEGLIEDLRRKHGIKCELNLMTLPDDPDDWKVVFENGHEIKVVDNWKDFPSQEFLAMLMLLGEMK